MPAVHANRETAARKLELPVDRLGELVVLSGRDVVLGRAPEFHDLKALLGTTDGNLSVHARKLEEAGYVAFSKSFHRRMPRTVYRLTPEGIEAAAWQAELRDIADQLTASCREVDPTSTDEAITQAHAADVVEGENVLPPGT